MKSFRKSYLVLEDSNYLKVMLWISLPILINSLLKSTIEILEINFLSSLKMPNGELNFLISSITITSPIFNFFSSLINVLTITGTIMITKALSKKDILNVDDTEKVIFKTNLIIGLCLNIISYCLSFFIFNKLTNLVVLKKSTTYFRIKSFEMIPLALYASFSSSKASRGDTVSPLLLTFCLFIINILLLKPLISKYKIEGIGMASLIANIIVGLICFGYFIKKKVNKKYNKEVLLEMFKIAFPLILSQIFLNLGFSIINNLIFKYNNQIASAIHVCNRLNTFLMLPINSLCSAFLVITSYNISSGNFERIKIFIKYVVKIIIILSLCDIIVVLPIRNWLLTILLNQDIELIELSGEYLIYVLSAIPVVGISQLFICLFQGYGYIKLSMCLSISMLWLIRIPFLFALYRLSQLSLHNIGVLMFFSNFISVLVALIIDCFKKYNIKKYQHT